MRCLCIETSVFLLCVAVFLEESIDETQRRSSSNGVDNVLFDKHLAAMKFSMHPSSNGQLMNEELARFGKDDRSLRAYGPNVIIRSHDFFDTGDGECKVCTIASSHFGKVLLPN
mmetsp:Transcript_50109/g.108911  ORF Transcript_50109/g.108911 Transcript_50109/m.108911 type:complete len:114 (-) Transcript_50109:104-445(-)